MRTPSLILPQPLVHNTIYQVHHPSIQKRYVKPFILQRTGHTTEIAC